MIVSFSWPARKKHNSVCLPFAIVPYSESYGDLSSSGRACISRVVGPPIADHAEVFCELSTWSKSLKFGDLSLANCVHYSWLTPDFPQWTVAAYSCVSVSRTAIDSHAKKSRTSINYRTENRNRTCTAHCTIIHIGCFNISLCAGLQSYILLSYGSSHGNAGGVVVQLIASLLRPHNTVDVVLSPATRLCNEGIPIVYCIATDRAVNRVWHRCRRNRIYFDLSGRLAAVTESAEQCSWTEAAHDGQGVNRSAAPRYLQLAGGGNLGQRVAKRRDL